MRERWIFLAISNDTNGLSLFRAPMPEDIFLTTSSGWFFQADWAFPTWSWYFSLGFTFAFGYCPTSSPGSSRCRRHMGKREDPGDEVAYCLAAVIFVLLYFTSREPIGLKDSKLCRYILEDFFSSIVTVSYSFLSHSLDTGLWQALRQCRRAKKKSGRGVKQQASEKWWEDYNSGALYMDALHRCT